MFDNDILIRLEAACMDSQAIEQKDNVILILKKRGIFLLALFGVNIFVSELPSLLPSAKGVLDILAQISLILFLVFFVRAGFALAIAFILYTQTKDYNGGYIEVYNDRIVVKQKAPI